VQHVPVVEFIQQHNKKTLVKRQPLTQNIVARSRSLWTVVVHYQNGPPPSTEPLEHYIILLNCANKHWHI